MHGWGEGKWRYTGGYIRLRGGLYFSHGEVTSPESRNYSDNTSEKERKKQAEEGRKKGEV
jgi:hypothetical protein